jgi:hypothetical protein
MTTVIPLAASQIGVFDLFAIGIGQRVEATARFRRSCSVSRATSPRPSTRTKYRPSWRACANEDTSTWAAERPRGKRAGYSAFIPHLASTDVFRRPSVSTRADTPQNEETPHLRGIRRSESKPTAGLEPATPSLRGCVPILLRFGSAPSFPAGQSVSDPRVIPFLFRRSQRVDAARRWSRLRRIGRVARRYMQRSKRPPRGSRASSSSRAVRARPSSRTCCAGSRGSSSSRLPRS